jgi:hypothetical protein
VPSADSDFALTAYAFAHHLAEHTAACGVTAEQVAEVAEAVSEYRAALAKTLHRRTRTQDMIGRKNAARRKAEEVVRRVANIIRANPDVPHFHKKVLRLKERPKRARPRKCPKRPPVLRFLGSGDGIALAAGTGGGSGVHVLEFRDVADGFRPDGGIPRRARPDGAVRLELFVDLVPVGEPVPRGPLDRVRSGRGWPWYLRSFTRSPIEVEFPLPAAPMLVCYWGRWADSAGDVSRFSNTCVARLEGWTPGSIPAPGNTALPADARAVLPDRQDAHRIEARCVILHLPYAEVHGDDDSIEHAPQPLLTVETEQPSMPRLLDAA